MNIRRHLRYTAKIILGFALCGLCVGIALPVWGFQPPTDVPPTWKGASTTLTAGKGPSGDTRLGIGTYNFLERLNIALGGIFQGEPVLPKKKQSALLNLPAPVNMVAVQGNYAYVSMAGSSDGSTSNVFRIIDVSNPAAPVIVGGSSLISGIPVGINAGTFAMAGRYAYLLFSTTAKANALRIIDISNPKAPYVVGGSNLGIDADMPARAPLGVYVAGRYIYITFSANSAPADRFRVIDIGNPTAPKVVAKKIVEFDGVTSADLPASGRGLYVANGYAYIALAPSGGGTINFAIIDVSKPPMLIKRAYISLTGTSAAARNVVVEGRFAYVALSATGVDSFRIVDLRDTIEESLNPTVYNPDIIPHALALPNSNANDIAVSGRYVYISYAVNGNNMLQIIDVQNIQSSVPAKIVGEDFSHDVISPSFVAVAGHYIYLAGATGFQIIDITGIESISARSQSVEAGSANIYGNAYVGGDFIVRGALTVGTTVLLGTTTVAGLDALGPVDKPMSTFRIDHPLDPLRKILSHSFVESPERRNIYDGIAMLDRRGEAEVELPGFMEALNINFRYQLSPADGMPAPQLHIKKEISDSRFVIGGGAPFHEVSWQITGERNDPWARAHPLVVEERKAEPACIYPEFCRSALFKDGTLLQ